MRGIDMQKRSGFCDRCNKAMAGWTLSKFNTEEVCGECIQKERAHPMYATACQAERKAAHSGEINYEKIGKPRDL
jgi:hypothetical protein